MFALSRKKEIPFDAPHSVLGAGMTLEAARITGNESVRIDGVYRGNIDIESNLVLGDTGHIIGDIRAQYVVLAGRVEGNIHCGTTVHFASSARVTGDIVCNALIIDEGSQVRGRYRVGAVPAEASIENPEKSYLHRSREINRANQGSSADSENAEAD